MNGDQKGRGEDEKKMITERGGEIVSTDCRKLERDCDKLKSIDMNRYEGQGLQ